MKEDLYIHLIYKQLAGEISPAENGQLEAWLQSSEDNRQTLASVSAAWEASAELTPTVEVDLDSEFAALDKRIQSDDKLVQKEAHIRKIQPQPKRSNRRFWLAAASLLFLATALFLTKDFILSDSSELVEVKSMEEIKELTLPDGSLVVLNKNSSLQYPKRFHNDLRQMELKGEAFFDVKPDKNRPFKINFEKSMVEVLGTSFNIKATSGEDLVVQVMTGTVKWENPTSSQVLSAGTTCTLDRATGKVNTRDNGGINADYWRSQKLQFDEIEVKFAIQELERLFDVQFSGMADSLMNCRFTAKFDNPSLGEILETLATVFDAQINKIDDNNYQLNGGECR